MVTTSQNIHIYKYVNTIRKVCMTCEYRRIIMQGIIIKKIIKSLTPHTGSNRRMGSVCVYALLLEYHTGKN